MEIDPPWPNKSVRRGNIYQHLTSDILDVERFFKELPVHKLCADNCYVLVWITNDPRCMPAVLLVLMFSCCYF